MVLIGWVDGDSLSLWLIVCFFSLVAKKGKVFIFADVLFVNTTGINHQALWVFVVFVIFVVCVPVLCSFAPALMGKEKVHRSRRRKHQH